MGAHGLWIGGLDVVKKPIRAVDLSGLLTVSAKRGENMEVPGRSGSIHLPAKLYEGTRAPFQFQLWGTLPDGSVPPDPSLQLWRDNLRRLGRVLSQPGLVPLVHQLPDGTFREVPVEVAVALDPEVSKTSDYGTVAIAFDSPSAFWRGQSTVSIPLSLANGATRTLTELDTCDAPIEDALVTFGPCTNPRLADSVTGTFLAYDAVIGSGQTLTINTATLRMTGTGGLVPDRTKLRTHATDARWLVLQPSTTGPAVVTFTHNGSGSVPVTIVARPSWLWG